MTWTTSYIFSDPETTNFEIWKDVDCLAYHWKMMFSLGPHSKHNFVPTLGLLNLIKIGRNMELPLFVRHFVVTAPNTLYSMDPDLVVH